MANFWLALLVFSTMLRAIVVQPQEPTVNITILHSATAEGAVCLDGSPPAYHLDMGHGSGLRSWIITIEGGGWCDKISNCYNRSNGRLGSSTKMQLQQPPTYTFGGILHNDPKTNPDFYNWNRVLVRYCDGSSFTGDVEDVDPDTKLYYRGARIFKAIMDDLSQKGMRNAENAILSGTSAGGLSTILNCDKFRSFLPENARVKCVANAGFFINAKTISGTSYIQEMYNRVVTLHINSTLVPAYLDPQRAWDHCKAQISNCTLSQRIIIQAFGVEFLKTFMGVTPCYTRGYFITSCHTHGRIMWTNYWFNTISLTILDKTIAEAVGDWYFDRVGFHQHLDPYPFAKDC
ncbi:pectin acetylesterase 8-like isoform X3 [Lycium barbarum]|uniref:pectin acetylesterase 8-like isoform X3 n=1 Tax=Lycium barbarum TaxID=112863 RepID=UPI00293EAAA6|nr:pectin acetylesterase 8-like isoform X3 [Lycium barbarum]